MNHSSKPSAAVADRPVGQRCRPDLTIVPQDYGAERYWLVKDPVTLSYFHLREEEYAILQMLDGQAGFAKIKSLFERRFAPYRLPYEQFQAFLYRLHQCGLILSDAPGQGEQLIERAEAGDRQRRFAAWSNLLAIRFRGIDPQPVLDWLLPCFGWCFSRTFLVLVLMLASWAAISVGVDIPKVLTGWDTIREFFVPANLAWLAVVLAGVKVVHEMGHALACRRFGGQCRELGLLLLVFTPCLYCDVSDAWTFKDKWRRIAVSMAGIVVEIMLATAATALWWNSQPGLAHSLFLNVMVVCSVSTLLINGNPLLRYDGYYVLADLLEVPNLSEQSQAVVSRAAAFLFLGIRAPSDRILPERGRWILALYGASSLVYRWFITLAILWFVHKIAQWYGIEVLGTAVIAATVAGLIMAPAWRFAAFLQNQSLQRGLRWVRAIVLLGIWGTLLFFLGLVPLPCRVTAPAAIEPEIAHRIYVVVPGTMVSAVREGQHVAKGQELVRLENSDIRKEVAELTGKRNQQSRELDVLRLRQAQDKTVAALIPTAESALADLDERLRQRVRDEESLVLRAPADGIVLPAALSLSGTSTAGSLAVWSGTPLDEKNRGCHLDTGTLVCMVGSALPLEAFAVVDQDSIALVKEGQRARIRIDTLPGEVFEGSVTEIATSDLKVAPREISAGGDLAVRLDPRGVARPASISYQVRIVLDCQPTVSLIGSHGQAKIIVPSQSAFEQIYRALRQTFEIRW